MGLDIKGRKLMVKDMGEVNFIMKTGACMTGNGNITRFMEEERFITDLVLWLVMEHGKKIL